MDIILERILSLIPQNENGRFIKGAAAEFAEKINVASNLPAEWKAGRNKSYRSKIRDISAAYNVSVDWLMGNTDEKSPSPVGDELDETTRAIFAEIDSMESDEDKLLALEMIRAIKRRRAEK